MIYVCSIGTVRPEEAEIPVRKSSCNLYYWKYWDTGTWTELRNEEGLCENQEESGHYRFRLLTEGNICVKNPSPGILLQWRGKIRSEKVKLGMTCV